jgi:hypothetical protein
MPADCLVPDQSRTFSANLNKQQQPEILEIGFLNVARHYPQPLAAFFAERGAGNET